MEKEIKIGFIGTGNMGTSLALAIKDYPNSILLLNNRTISKAENLQKKSRIVKYFLSKKLQNKVNFFL